MGGGPSPVGGHSWGSPSLRGEEAQPPKGHGSEKEKGGEKPMGRARKVGSGGVGVPPPQPHADFPPRVFVLPAEVRAEEGGRGGKKPSGPAFGEAGGYFRQNSYPLTSNYHLVQAINYKSAS